MIKIKTVRLDVSNFVEVDGDEESVATTFVQTSMGKA